jgi:hypothetical protein
MASVIWNLSLQILTHANSILTHKAINTKYPPLNGGNPSLLRRQWRIEVSERFGEFDYEAAKPGV